ncbi:prolipoprotein diacylglyceryl transferase [Tepidibacter formicigenes]|jgi:16S rRNA (cytosine1402-N4)-methyltransferase/phosphatidylglycerol:prolipoprotein diacylglycerol transferase|uniref:Phosphatidylglycerol--prolipoprotein diacylglyceryl transferase n=1 Tax=Tepidibacter formicigenes DSM 15518 TaxID=1123349 RepID=A0A1M6KB41_9FIRM|nr:prolipoprotein diacylglyceryl transferase [Tepidibacter formicigenes]SHJ56119.1 phosphatidylglycerol:prolipoprotein diacylglycerol transferase [Tepidibacter formicigenes DSM 15518]
MNPIAFTIFGIDIRWYGILISTGIMIGIFLALKEAKRVSINEEKLLDLFLIAIPCAIIGARTYYVIFNWDYYKGDLFKIINIRGGGLAIHGGIIGAVLVGYLYCKIKKMNFRKILDLTAPSIALGQAIGRWGNFINQEAYGRPTNLPWAINVNGVNVHPTFLYESIWDFCLFLFLMWLRKNKKYDGHVFICYAIIYSIGRFFVEGFRIDSLMLGTFRMAQVISIIFIVLGSIVHINLKNKNKL